MKIFGLVVGMIEANCYLVACKETLETMVIDPGADGNTILDVIKENNLKVKYIVNTHGHHDHIGANQEVKDGTNAPLLIHTQDAPLLKNPRQNLAAFLGIENHQPSADQLLNEGDIIEIGELSFKVLHTPGHTAGGISLYNEEQKVCFTGDTLFYGSIGRTDLPGGNYSTLIKGIKEKIFSLPDDVTIYPGHGPETTVAQEKKINPFLQ